VRYTLAERTVDGTAGGFSGTSAVKAVVARRKTFDCALKKPGTVSPGSKSETASIACLIFCDASSSKCAADCRDKSAIVGGDSSRARSARAAAAPCWLELLGVSSAAPAPQSKHHFTSRVVLCQR
jgi:hypothetical protein